VSIVLDLQPVEAPLHAAIYLGLIVNEILTNSYKYAFEHNQQGEIKLTLYTDAKQLVLILEDNGKGFETPYEETRAHSMGFQLIDSLVESLDGVLEVTNKQGACFTLKMPLMRD